MPKPSRHLLNRHLLDVNVLVALLDEDHAHHALATKWFATPRLQWALLPFTEAGFLRYMTRPKKGGLSMEEATAMLSQMTRMPGYHYQPISGNWNDRCKPFFKRLFGHNQTTDAYLLGLALQENLILVTFDKGILHLAGERSSHVLVLSEPLPK